MPFSFKVGGVGGKLTMSLDAMAAANKKAAAAAKKKLHLQRRKLHQKRKL